METTNKFKYKIRSFDKQSLKLTVDFEDGRWAQLTLVAPLPTTKGGLEQIISRYTQPMEYNAALIDDTVDLSYIDRLVGVEQEAPRMWLNPPPPPAPRPVDPETGKLVEEVIAEVLGAEASENQVLLYSELEQLKTRYSNVSYLLQPEMLSALTEGSALSVKQWASNTIEIMKRYQQAIINDSDYTPGPDSVDLFVEFKKPGDQ